ncbi:MAG: membrane integrity-associated transporter subunit PqiC [Acidobacteria bacterium]|nr:membrane integrity-associated transporter subunit PqiC [Acidobacteriota bacterium]
MPIRTIIEPFKIKTVEPIRWTTRAEREELLRQAHYNLFLLPAEDVLIDLLTDSGTSAMSQEQWAGIQRGDESDAGSRSYYRLRDEVQALTGFEHFIPTHQGRAAERILFGVLCGAGQVVPNNTHFDTTRANVEASGAQAVDCLIAEGRDPSRYHPFKGNMDLVQLDGLIEKHAAEQIPFVLLTITTNWLGAAPAEVDVASGGPALGVGPVHLPSYLERTTIVTRRENQLSYNGMQRWAGSLESEFLQALGANLARMLGSHRVAVYPEGYHMLLRDLQGQVVWRDIAAWLADPTARLPSGADASGRVEAPAGEE